MRDANGNRGSGESVDVSFLEKRAKANPGDVSFFCIRTHPWLPGEGKEFSENKSKISRTAERGRCLVGGIGKREREPNKVPRTCCWKGEGPFGRLRKSFQEGKGGQEGSGAIHAFDRRKGQESRNH